MIPHPNEPHEQGARGPAAPHILRVARAVRLKCEEPYHFLLDLVILRLILFTVMAKRLKTSKPTADTLLLL